MFDGKAFGKEMVDIVKAHVAKTVEPLVTQIEALNAEIERLKGLEAKYLIDRAVLVDEIMEALPEPQNGKDADPALMATMVEETVERVVAALPAAKDGTSVTVEDIQPLIEAEVTKAVTLIELPKDGEDGFNGKDGTNGLDGKDGANGVNGKDGRDGLDLKDLLVVEGGELVATLTDGRTKVLGPFRGKDGAPGESGKSVDVAEIERMIAEKVAKIQPPEIERDAYTAVVTKMIEEAVSRQSTEVVEEFAPDDVAMNVSSAIKMMAERPLQKITEPDSESKASPTNINIALSDTREPQPPVAIHLPEAKAPVVEVAAPIVNVTVPEQQKRRTRTTVKKHDANGRITEFEQEEI